MKRLLSAIIVAIVMTGGQMTGLMGSAVAQDRVALVVGIDNYAKLNHLQKATNDARAVADSLRRLGFRVELALDVDRRGFDRAISNFINTITPGAIAYFHYSGHGVSIDNDTFLIPTDMELPRSEDREFVKREAIRLSELIESLKNAKARSRVLVIDACRENPFAARGVRSIGASGGIALLPAPEGTLIMYSAAEGQTALDGLGTSDREPTSVYTRTLLKHLAGPGETMVEMAREVRREVEALAKTVGHDQRPSYYDELSDDLRLVPGGAAAVANAAPTPPIPPAPPSPPGPANQRRPPLPAPVAPQGAGNGERVADLPLPVRPPAPANAALPDALPPGVTFGELLHGTNLPGSNYQVLDLPQADPSACQAACRADNRCAAWSYVKPSTAGQSARCGLKPVIPSRLASNCCLSAIERAPEGPMREAPPVPPALVGALRGIVFAGGNFRTFGNGDVDPQQCQAACRAETRCLVWTYVRPGIGSQGAACYLKKEIPPQVGSACCISGVEREAAADPGSAGAAAAVVPPPPVAEARIPSGPLLGINLQGSSYRSFPLAAANPMLCAGACKAEGHGLAWTYVRPGEQGPKPALLAQGQDPPALGQFLLHLRHRTGRGAIKGRPLAWRVCVAVA